MLGHYAPTDYFNMNPPIAPVTAPLSRADFPGVGGGGLPDARTCAI